MSQVYATEPQTSGSVVFETTHGPLSVHLWCKECPHTVRFFLQLCLDGFYDGLIFHRIIPNFLVQTGDPQYRQKDGVQDEDEKSPIYRQPLPDKYRQKHQAPEALERRQYELNSRIRFNHRGQIAMALGIDDNDNDSQSLARLQPQFFITLDEASHLDGKHVCFGGITGPTIFNALRIGQADIVNDSNDEVRNFQPRILSEAPRILRTKILDVDLPPTLPALAPTQDVSLLPWRVDPKSSTAKGAKDTKKRKKKNRKGVKNINLLSFGEEMNEEEGIETKASAKGMKSSHDVLTSKSLSKKKTEIKPSEEADPKPSIPTEPSVQTSRDPTPTTKSEPPKPQPKTETLPTKESVAPSESHIPTFSSRKDRIEAKQANEAPAAAIEPKKKKKDKAKKISLVEARRAKYAKKNSNRKGSTKQAREDETMAKFKAFQKKLNFETAGGKDEKEAAVYHGQVLEQQDNDNSRDWIKTEFKCKRHMDQDAKARGGDGRGADDYLVVEERSSATDRKPGKRKRYRQDL